MNPNVVLVPAASEPLKDALRTVTVLPEAVNEPFHNWVTVTAFGKDRVVVQLVIAEAPAVTVTSPWNPPDQALTSRNEPEQLPPPPPPAVVVTVTGAENADVLPAASRARTWKR